MNSIKNLALIVVMLLGLVLVLFVLVGLVIAETGFVPSSGIGWGLLIVFGPIGYLLAQGLGELGMKHVDSKTKQLATGSAGRIGILVLIGVAFLVVIGCLTYLARG